MNINMESRNYIADILIYLILLAAIEAQVILKTCSRDNVLNCPKNSLCTQISKDDIEALKCICIENFQLNLNWLEYKNLSSSLLLEEHYCVLSSNITTAQENKLIVYMRSPARKEHLIFGILMVLLAATLATAVLYGIKALKLLKRTKAVYQKLKHKRRNITPLQEMDELELNRHYEMQILSK